MLLARSHRLPDGLRVRLRFPHSDDLRRVVDLHARLGLEIDEMAARRLVRFDPRSMQVVCALAWVDGSEVLVGIGARPGSFVTDETVAPGVGRLLRDALAQQERQDVA